MIPTETAVGVDHRAALQHVTCWVQVGKSAGDIVTELQDLLIRQRRLLVVIDPTGQRRPRYILQQNAHVGLRTSQHEKEFRQVR
eukprot:scaffold371197_cov31-Prasinocladus_malaysianus.AAC.2